MTVERIAATRMNLVRARRDLVRVEHGIVLTRRKREALVAELFRLARPAVDVRARIAQAASDALGALAGALAVHGASGLEAMAWSVDQPTVELRPAQVWGLAVSDVERRTTVVRTFDARGLAPGAVGPAASDAAARFEALVDLLIEAAPREQRVRRLSDAVRETTRRLVTLEHRVAPRLVTQVAVVRQQLDEREREEHLRLRHVKGASARGDV